MIERRLDEVISMWNSGVPRAEIAAIVGVLSESFDGFVIRHRGMFPKRKRDNITPEETEIAANLWAQGKSSKEIATAIACSARQIDKMARADRERFPVRGAQDRYLTSDQRSRQNIQKAGVMTFVTSTGYECTLPAVSILKRAA